MIDLKRLKKYCNEDITLIENYEKAINDNTQTWNCHHRLETEKNMSVEDLIDENLYYNRPANELILLTKTEHNIIHNIGKIRKCSEETKRKISEANKGRKQTEEEKNKRSEILKEYYKHNKRTEETKRKISEANKGKSKIGHLQTEETKRKISEKLKGKIVSEETKRKISEAKKTYWLKRKISL